MKAILKYRGPWKGLVRFLGNRKKVEERYEYMLRYLADRISGGRTLEESIDWVNWDCAGDDLGIYLFPIKDERVTTVAFGFRDCEMKDIGMYKLVG